ncbi:MAG: efflux RND transporter periplasmic adaptor subunit [Anaerolineales bacterium]
MSRVLRTPSLILILILALVLGACSSSGGGKTLQASGTVESRRVVISSDLGGEVVELNVQEGDRVQAGDVLLLLDDTLYAVQRAQAEAGLEAAMRQQAAAQAQDNAAKAGVAAAQANLDAAQAQLDLARAGALLDQNAGGFRPWVLDVPGAFDRPGWYFDPSEQIDAAQSLVDSASADLQDALDALAELLRGADYTGVAQAEADLAQARATYVLADQMRREAVSRERYRLALEGYYALLTGEQSLTVQAAQAGVDAAAAAVTQAEAAAEAAYAGAESAGQAVDQAQSALDLVQAQIEKLTVRAPITGTILTVSTTRGETLLPGTPALTLGKLDDLTITVYIPEDRYGEVSLGGEAQVSADSFPGKTFKAKVTRIADQAEYTPRNVQTKEERQTTVYAVELTLLEGLDQLKPGMPADVVFESGGGG